MRKLFGGGNKRKKTIDALKPSDLKIPVPMIHGAEYADLTESQISTIISGGNSSKRNSTGDYYMKKPSTGSQIEKASPHPIVPKRSISSPPALLMPKPHYSLPPTRFLLGNHEFEKTQIEDTNDAISISSESEQLEQDDNILELQEKSPITNHHQSSSYITRTSDDSNRQYVSASESPFFTASSVISNNLNTKSSSSIQVMETIPKDNINNNNNVSKDFQPIVNPEYTKPIIEDNKLLNLLKSNSSYSSNDVDIRDFPLPPQNTVKKTKVVSRPATSSSASSATVGHDVTQVRNSLANNNDKPPVQQFQNISSESSALFKKPMHQGVNTTESIADILESEIKKLSFKEDILDLRRTVERLQQQRASDLEEHLLRVQEQKIKEKEILQEIKFTKEKLELAIAGNLISPPKETVVEEPPALKPSTSNKTNRKSNEASLRQKNRKSFPSIPNNSRLMNDYFPDIKSRPPEFIQQQYPPVYGGFYGHPPPPPHPPQDLYPEEMMRYEDPYYPESPRLRAPRRRQNQRQPRSRSLDPPGEDIDTNYSFVPTDQQQSIRRKASFHSAKSEESDNEEKHKRKSRYRIPLDDMMYNGQVNNGNFPPPPPPHPSKVRHVIPPPYVLPNEYFSYMPPPPPQRLSPRMNMDEQPQMWGSSNPSTPFWDPYGVRHPPPLEFNNKKQDQQQSQSQQQQHQQQQQQNNIRRFGSLPNKQQHTPLPPGAQQHYPMYNDARIYM